ncbi:PREDICTED: heterogeneous nuclear ribonucleoprotein L-like, partial [Chaetura pelagica]|uniref:heterogeneous nuclear ribonucleoprotein L-like n=1 Tax=Chaetura pelagica TaxID=8897 RepID=UPI000523B0AD
MPKKRQALVEFEDILGACNAVNYAADNQIYIAGHPAFVNYSTSQKISRPGDTDDSRGVNNVLLFTILNPIYSITTVKFMKSKPGAAMVEMADGYAVDRAITHLNNNFMFGQKLNVCVSKQQAIMPGQSYGLEDGSCSYKDFSGSRNNRFSTPEQAAKNRIQHPSNVLHFFNAPLEVTEDNFYEICDELG